MASEPEEIGEIGKDITTLKARLESLEQAMDLVLVPVRPSEPPEGQVKSEEHESDHRADPNTGTTVRINKTRTCTPRPGGGQWCTPWVRHSADIYLGPSVASQLARGAQQAATAISAALAASGCGAPAAPWVLLAGQLVVIGYGSLKNPDGSINLHVTNTTVNAGVANIPVSIDPASSAAILNAL